MVVDDTTREVCHAPPICFKAKLRLADIVCTIIYRPPSDYIFNALMQDSYFKGGCIDIVRYPDLELRPHKVPSLSDLVIIRCVDPQLRLVSPDHSHLNDC
jgi:hypothetical protein